MIPFNNIAAIVRMYENFHFDHHLAPQPEVCIFFPVWRNVVAVLGILS